MGEALGVVRAVGVEDNAPPMALERPAQNALSGDATSHWRFRSLYQQLSCLLEMAPAGS
jgi:hypothetical protein